MSSLSLDQALSKALASYAGPVIAPYRLGLLMFGLRREVPGGGRRARSRDVPLVSYAAGAAVLVDYGLLKPIARGVAFQVLGRAIPGAADAACAIDPFAYVSHLSAMEMHGLTERVSRTLFLSTPDRPRWGREAQDLMQRDLDQHVEQYLEEGFPALHQARFSRLLGRPVERAHRSQWGAFRRLGDSEVRVATLGRTFLDMLREPDACGGIQHVLDVYRAHASRHLQLIVDELEQHGEPIDKVRAGYVLEEACRLQHAAFASWRTFVTRGGSRKLVAKLPYAPTFSERWALSLNA